MIHYLSATELARRIRARELSAEAALECCLERFTRHNGVLNAVVVTDLEGARKRARQADAALARGELWGPLHGVPMTVKESWELAGWPTTSGAPRYREHVSTLTAEALRRLLDAGAVIYGKTNVPLLTGDLQTYNALYGQTNNPWDLARTCGGSSGGSAVALAVGMTPLELGSDIGGSIRTPASFCGVLGHKPSYGIIPKRGHVPGAPGSLSSSDISVAGPMARYVEDLELALDLLAGPDEDEAVGWRLVLPPPRARQLAAFRIAAWLDDTACPVDRQIVELLEGLTRRLREHGAVVDCSARPRGVDLARSHAIYYDLLTATLASDLPDGLYERLVQRAAGLGSEDTSYEARFARGTTQDHRHWLRIHEQRLRLRRSWAAFFDDFDVLLAPVTHVPPFPHDHSAPQYERSLSVNGVLRPYLDILVWAGLPGVAYLPVTVVPAGRTRDGLPIGVQIIGPYLEDRTTLAFARVLESMLGGFTPPPGYD